MENFKRFVAEYEKQLRIAAAEHPNEYNFGGISIDVVVAKMSNAFANGTYNKDGRAIKATCKVLGINHTYKAINGFLMDGLVRREA